MYADEYCICCSEVLEPAMSHVPACHCTNLKGCFCFEGSVARFKCNLAPSVHGTVIKIIAKNGQSGLQGLEY